MHKAPPKSRGRVISLQGLKLGKSPATDASLQAGGWPMHLSRIILPLVSHVGVRPVVHVQLPSWYTWSGTRNRDLLLFVIRADTDTDSPRLLLQFLSLYPSVRPVLLFPKLTQNGALLHDRIDKWLESHKASSPPSLQARIALKKKYVVDSRAPRARCASLKYTIYALLPVLRNRADILRRLVWVIPCQDAAFVN